MTFFNSLFNIFAWLISKLPFWILYLISDFFYLILYYILGYRKQVVYKNLRNSFPEKNDIEIRKIAKQNYQNLCDIVMESLKKKGMTEEEFLNHFKGVNFEILEKLHKENRNIIGAMGHFGNFEWIISYLAIKNPSKTYVAAKPLSNKFFDNFATKTRSMFGLVPYHYKQTYALLESNQDTPSLTIIVGDQTPTRKKAKYWTSFLNQETTFYLGIEKMSKLFNLAVVFFDIHKIKRGHYQVECKLLSENPQTTEDFEIIEKYIRQMERSIIEHPTDWTWSHRRWKHKKNKINN